MELVELAHNWDLLGKQQTITAIISTLGTEDEQVFFETGLTEIKWLLELLQEADIEPVGPVLDFGCGIGRLTQALAHRFTEVVGLDIAPSMLKVAEEKNAFPDRCTYVLNQTDNLEIFEDAKFSLIVSSIVLQHVGEEFAKKYLSEMVRVLKPGGILFFQIPSQLKEIPVIRPEACRAKITADLSPYSDRMLSEAETTSDFIPGEHRRDKPGKWQKVFGDRFGGKTVAATDTASRIAENSGPFLQAAPGEVLVFQVSIFNASESDWESGHGISLGRRWLSYPENLLLAYTDDGGRVALSDGLKSRDTVTAAIEIRMPVKTGNYLLELDLSQPGYPLFADLGSERYLLPIKIADLPGKESVLDAGRKETLIQNEDPPQEVILGGIEMYGINRSEVEDFLLQNGMEIIRTIEDNSAGGSWQSYRYLARKP